MVWGKTILRLIEIILVLPANSADAERSFSIMNHIKYDRRSSITSENLDNLMRIRINKLLTNYAKLWIKAGHLCTDDPMRHRKQENVETADDEEDHSETGKILMASDIF